MSLTPKTHHNKLLTVAEPNTVQEASGFGSFPGMFFVIALGNGLYAANNATTTDLYSVDGLACFPSVEDAEIYMTLPDSKGLSGKVEQCTFDNAREIAKAKCKLNCLVLFCRGKIIEIHYVE